jgi:hypothetical protein
MAATARVTAVRSIRRGRDHRAEARGDQIERLVPRDALEASFSLASDPAQGVKDAVGAVDPVQVLVDLGAQEAAGETMVGVAPDRHRAIALHLHRHHAGVGAVVGADHLAGGASRGDGRHRHL